MQRAIFSGRYFNKLYMHVQKTNFRLIYTYTADWNTNLKHELSEIQRNCNIEGRFFWGGCVFRKCVLPEGLAKEPLKIMKINTYLVFIGYTMVLTISTRKLDATNTPDAFKHVPDLFWRAQGLENKV